MGQGRGRKGSMGCHYFWTMLHAGADDHPTMPLLDSGLLSMAHFFVVSSQPGSRQAAKKMMHRSVVSQSQSRANHSDRTKNTNPVFSVMSLSHKFKVLHWPAYTHRNTHITFRKTNDQAEHVVIFEQLMFTHQKLQQAHSTIASIAPCLETPRTNWSLNISLTHTRAAASTTNAAAENNTTSSLSSSSLSSCS